MTTTTTKTLPEMADCSPADLRREALTADNRAYAKALTCVAEALDALAMGDRALAGKWLAAAKTAYARSVSEAATLASVRATQAVVEAEGTAIRLREGERKNVGVGGAFTAALTFDWHPDASTR
jgi:hypothetical protein